MTKFTDEHNREWTLRLTVATNRRVQELAGVNLLTVFDNEGALWLRLQSDPEVLANVLCALCRPELAGRNLSDEEFADGLAGDAWQAAVDALADELIAFSRPCQREHLRAALDAAGKAERQLAQAAAELAAEIHVPMEELKERGRALIQERLRRLTGTPTSGSSPDLPALSPAH